MAGAPCPIELMKEVNDRMHLREITIAYGMTETSPVTFQTAIDDSFDRRVATVGKVMPHTEAKVVDEAGQIVPPGTSGELLARGYCVMAGYWDDPVHTAESIDKAGWMHTGDIATIDRFGYGRIVGRLKDMVIRGGENLFPREIEEFLYRHPKIEEVEVFGVPDPKYGEELCAWILLRPGEHANEDDIRNFCEGQIARHKIPRYIRFVDRFPLTATGKVQKFKMREAMIRSLDSNGNARVAKRRLV
jgi:fatty-acyl-CoA synthase